MRFCDCLALWYSFAVFGREKIAKRFFSSRRPCVRVRACVFARVSPCRASRVRASVRALCVVRSCVSVCAYRAGVSCVRTPAHPVCVRAWVDCGVTPPNFERDSIEQENVIQKC